MTNPTAQRFLSSLSHVQDVLIHCGPGRCVWSAALDDAELDMSIMKMVVNICMRRKGLLC